MKLLLSFITLFSLVSSFVNSQNLYINIFPYQNQCGGLVEGVGFSAVIGKCINNMGSFLDIDKFDYNSFKFGYESVANKTYLYAEIYEQQNCDISSGVPETYSYDIGGCEESLVYVNVSAKVNGNFGLSQYTFVSITKQPDFPNDSQIYAVYSFSDPFTNETSSSESSNSDSSDFNSSGSPICDLDNFLYATTISNNLEIDYSNGITQTFSCSDKLVPTVKYCPVGKKCYNKRVEQSCFSTSTLGFNQMNYCTN